jgi:hypothetical protein
MLPNANKMSTKHANEWFPGPMYINMPQKPFGREVPVPKRCTFHRNVEFSLQIVARA